jgi:hypothetical protein
MYFAKLDASVGASGPHDFAVRISAVRPQHISVHRIPFPTSVTIASRPSLGTRQVRSIPVSTNEGSGIFLQRGMDRKMSDLPVGLVDAALSTSLPATNAKRLRKGAKRRSNPHFAQPRDGLLRFARNDGVLQKVTAPPADPRNTRWSCGRWWRGSIPAWLRNSHCLPRKNRPS